MRSTLGEKSGDLIVVVISWRNITIFSDDPAAMLPQTAREKNVHSP
jgi:hypothetical protein